MTRVKNKRIKKSRLAIVILVPVLAILLIGLGVSYAYNAHIQSERHTLLDEKKAARSAFLERVDTASRPESVEQESFARLQALAKEENAEAYTILAEFGEEDPIDEESFEKIQALQPEADGADYLQVLEQAEEIGQFHIDFLLRDDDRMEFVLNLSNAQNYQNPPAAIDASLDSVPLLLQWDLDWGYIPYGDVTIQIGGCAPTSAAMVYSYLLQDPTITPAVLAKWSDEHGTYVPGAGTAHSFFWQSAEDYGLNCQAIPVTREDLENALSNGEIVIASVNPGDFTRVGHILVIAGMKDGKLIINDPNSIKNSSVLWDIDQVIGQTAALFAYSKP